MFTQIWCKRITLTKCVYNIKLNNDNVELTDIVSFSYYVFKIMECHLSQEFSDSSIQCKTWKDVVEHSVRSPKLMLQALQDRERFDLVRQWIDVFGYPSQLREVGVIL